MSKFSQTKPKVVQPNTRNKAGGRAYQESAKLELASILLTSFLQDTFYSSGDSTMNRLAELVHEIPDKEFVAKAAIMAREWGMRSVTHVVIAELCHDVKGEEWLRLAIAKAIQRPDDASEILAYWMSTYGKPIPNALKRGIADGLAKFNEYNIAKYKGEGHALKMVDVVNLVHPKSAVLGKLVNGTLETPYTWETEITKAGSDPVEKTKAWTQLVESGKLGYFALLRNLRNLEEMVSESTLSEAYKQLTNREAIKRSKVLPFRYDTALDQVSRPKTRQAISKAIDIAVDNMPELGGKTLIALDCSGSMASMPWGYRGKSKRTPLQVASLFAAVIAKAADADIMQFGTSVSWPKYNPADSVLTIAGGMRANHGGTDFHLIFDKASKAYDRIIILSDMQAWVHGGYGTNTPQEALKRYRSRTGANPNIWSFDLAGYGTLQFPENKVYTLAGFSEKVFDIIPMIEEGDKHALIKRIEQTSIA
ncbi:MAG: TROVE domain-containing protein [Methanofastidiosum sp.]